MNDLAPLLTVYAYVVSLVLISEKAFRNELVGRKFLHIMVGNIAFLLPFFESRYVMTFLAAFPFVILTFLMSPYSPIKIRSRTTLSGHALGLFYYSIAWTILAFFLFDRRDAISMGIVAMSYGDGFASLIGTKYGKRRFKIFGAEKSLEGSLAMFFASLTMFAVIQLYYIGSANLLILPLAIIATIIEAITPKGLDNLSVSLTIALLYVIL
ncbi:MAG: SEC59/DGK1/VTE5 family protein [Archaeoglobaceae archaeon]|nr:SEC59/DGK1/VTE5 family protein [Archaeoglobaceae archaeon]MDW8118289.1 SEC59/DGK1/VTE5 family protein [Archaeoglobaceae archaeon]